MGSMHPQLAARLVKWVRDLPREQVHIYFTFKVAPVDRARNQIVEYFLTKRVRNNEPFTHLLMIDADTIPPEDAIERLLSHDKDIVTGLTPILRYDAKTGAWDTNDNAFTHVDRDEKTGKVITTHVARRHHGLQQVFRCGGSCLLVKRRVFEAILPPHFQFESNENGTIHTRSEDIYFCDLVKFGGFEIYADTHVVCGHYKEIML